MREDSDFWDVKTGEERQRGRQHTAAVHAMALSRDGRLVLTRSNVSSAFWWTLPELGNSR